MILLPTCKGGTQDELLARYIGLLTTARLAEIEPDELDHVGLEEVHVPPGRPLHLREAASLRREEVARAPVHGPLRDASRRHARLHRSFARCHVEHWMK